ncbi:hypothetical protein ABFT80_25525 [Mesorhizobium sp. SB112]|uniref:hypothetical protein n=1 Tax=Mesorhizobium sp. SB112 TaxID=3151853 RepID=UPI003264A2AA
MIKAEDVPHEFIVGDVRIEEGTPHLTYGPHQSQAVAFPESIEATEDPPSKLAEVKLNRRLNSGVTIRFSKCSPLLSD